MLSTRRSPLLPTHLLKLLNHSQCSFPLLAILPKKLRTSSIAHLFSTSKSPQPPSFQTASAQLCSSIPHDNSAPPPSHMISLHDHLVVAAMHSFLYNISHTPKEISHALPCSSNRETATTKKTANKANLTSKIRKCSHWCGDLISCYTVSYITYLFFSKKCFLSSFIILDFLTIRVLNIVKNLHTNLVANVSTIPTTIVWHIN